jgi:hypothetical protein
MSELKTPPTTPKAKLLIETLTTEDKLRIEEDKKKKKEKKEKEEK